MTYPIINPFATTINVDILLTSVVTGIVTFLPKLLVALTIFFVGKLLAKSFSGIVTKIISAQGLAKFVNSFQLGATMKEEMASGIITAVGLLIRYAIMYVSLILAFQVLGLTGIADFLASLVSVLPKLLSALLILLIGVIIAGLIESLVKRALITLDPATARLVGKVTSYTVVSFFALMSLAELGIAATFINTLFIGLVASVSLASGLAVGLGAKDLIKDILSNWYKQRTKSKK
jgi:small-conductance mechanosensitive channel